MTEQKPKVRYDIGLLTSFCEDNNIKLEELEITDEKININTVIKGLCNTDNCDNLFSKKFGQLLK